MPVHPQESPNWCWAASAQMVMHAQGTDVKQCQQLNRLHDRRDCPCDRCSGGQSVACNWGGEPDFDTFGFECKRRKGALSWNDLKRQLSSTCFHAPVAFGWKWTDAAHGMRHMMVAYGYEEVDGMRWVLIVNPLHPLQSCTPQIERITYEEYVSGSDHVHTLDLHNVRPKP